MDPSPRPSPPTDTLTAIDAARGGEGEKEPASVVGRATWRRVTFRVAIAVYWIAMFLATHLPVQRVMDELPASDKHLHLGAYAVLGFALPWWSPADHRRSQGRSRWQPAMLCLLLLTYAAIDELLQIPVGRSAEWGDWIADAVGAAVGVAIGSFASRVR